MPSRSQNDNNAVMAYAAVVVAFLTLIAQVWAALYPLLNDQVPSVNRLLFLIFFSVLIIMCTIFIWRTGVFPKSLSVLILVLGLAPLIFGFYSYGLSPRQPPGGQGLQAGQTPPNLGPVTPPSEALAQQEFTQGMRFYGSGEYRQACEKFNNAIARRADFFDAYKYLGLSYKAMGEYEEAKVPLKEAYKLNSDAIRKDLADVYILSIRRWKERGYKDKALREIMFLRDYDPPAAQKLMTELGGTP
jgi:hypothetical protein